MLPGQGGSLRWQHPSQGTLDCKLKPSPSPLDAFCSHPCGACKNAPCFPQEQSWLNVQVGTRPSPCKPIAVSKSLAFDPCFEPENYSSLPTPERVRIHFYIDFKVCSPFWAGLRWFYDADKCVLSQDGASVFLISGMVTHKWGIWLHLPVNKN